MPGHGRVPAELRHLDDRITLYVMPGPGGRWLPAIHTTDNRALERLPLQATIDDARAEAEIAGRRARRVAEIADPALADTALANFADSGHYQRDELAALIGHRLDHPDAQRVATAEPDALVELLGSAGFSPATIVAVLHAEALDPTTVAGLLPTVGVPMPDAIQALRERWDVKPTDAAEALGATAAEMRDAGCTPTEIMATRPRDVLRALPDDPHLWDLAAGTMAVAGHSTSRIAAHLVAHAPTPDAFAAGLTAVAEPADGLALAARQHGHPDQLAAASEAYGLSPAETAGILVGTTDPEIVLDTVAIRCGTEPDAVTVIAAEGGITPAEIDRWRQPSPPAPVTAIRSGIDLDTAALLATLPLPGPATDDDPMRLLDSLAAGIEPTALETTP